MKVSVRLRQIDKVSGEEKILAETGGLMTGQRLLYPESKGVSRLLSVKMKSYLKEKRM